MSKKRAVITGVTGQDGAYLSKLLLDKGYEVYGTYRRTSSVNFWRLQEVGINTSSHPYFHLIEYDLTDPSASVRLIQECEPDELYNLAAQSFVGVSFGQPITTAEATALGTLNLLEAIRLIDKDVRFYQASSSEMFGKVQTVPQTEETPFYPRSPYGVSKLFAHWISLNYRESYDIFAVSGILFNHESPLRGREFVTRKITDGVAKIKLNHAECLELGNLDAVRDWGFAQEYVEGMWRMLQQPSADTFVLATNRAHTVREFVTLAFRNVGVEISWEGSGERERGIDISSGKTIVHVNPKYYRPAEVDALIGNPAKAKEMLGWEAKTTLDELCGIMVQTDLARNESGTSF